MSALLQSSKLAIAYYGDDFTGSTDALEFLCRAGLKTRLFLKPSHEIKPDLLAGLDAVGLAGRSRSMTTEQLETELFPAFQFLASLHPEHLHYKVCSTFDSSPTIGSIGRAIEIGRSVTNSTLVPLLVGAPLLGRYCFMGNLFARMGIGSAGEVYRLDRHPSMSKHPVTPATESDLRLQLAKQTALKCGLLPFMQLDRTDAEPIWQEALDRHEDVLLIDAFEQEQLTGIGSWLNTWSEKQLLFSVGSSGIEMALGQYWNLQQRFLPQKTWPPLESVKQLLVVSGSCSPVTGGQIEFALKEGFQECIVDASRIHDAVYAKDVFAYALQILRKGVSLILHGNGTRSKQNEVASDLLGCFLGKVVKELMQEIDLPRVLIAGGDTSGQIALQLDIEALELLAPLSPGAPVCKAVSEQPQINGKQFVFKGGQLGTEDYFERVRTFSS